MNSPGAAGIVHVVDDDASIRSALTRLLLAAGFEPRTYRSAAEFLAAERTELPGCVVLDLGLPGMSGIELQAATAGTERALPIVFLTGRGDIETGVRAMKAGAVDFLTKPVKRDVLLSAVAAALSTDRERRKRRDEARSLQARLDTLTSREREVYDRVVGGKLNKQIAVELGTSVRTVKAHRARVMQKMSVTSFAELVRIADQLTALRTAE